MSVVPTDPLPSDVHETLVRLSNSVGLSPADVLREALELYARELEDRQAAERAERITPRVAELKAILARTPRRSTWSDVAEAPF
jgi:predicted DNA-binding protein